MAAMNERVARLEAAYGRALAIDHDQKERLREARRLIGILIVCVPKTSAIYNDAEAWLNKMN